MTIVLLVLGFTALTANGNALDVSWQAKSYAADALPSEMSEAARAAVKDWAEFAKGLGYRMVLSDDARVLLISATSDSVRARHEQLIANTTALFDKLLPAPAKRTDVRNPASGGKKLTASNSGESTGRSEPARENGPAEIPEDPEQPRVPLVSVELNGTSWEYTLGAITVPMDTQTIVLLVLRQEKDYGKVLDLLQEHEPYLAAFARQARRLTGFVLQQPLTGAFLESATGMEEWNPENELVNRLAQLLMIRRFRLQPFWLQQGFAWHAEMTLLNGVYCFPYRQGFVSAGEHTGWDNVLANDFTKRNQPLKLEEFATWKRNTYKPSIAHIAWGVVDYLAQNKATALPSLLEELRVCREKNDRKDNGDGTWKDVADYEIPADAQLAILEKHAGKSFLQDVTASLRKPKRK